MEHDKISDRELVLSVRSGDLHSFDIIVSRYKNMLFSVAMNIVSDYHIAEDIVQETFIDCYLGISALKDVNKLYSWLYGIAKRKSLHIVSRKRIHLDIDEYSNDLFDYGSSLDEILIQKETSQEVKKAVLALSEKNRQVAELFYFQDMSVNEIAQKLLLHVGTVKSRLYEARNKLKGELSYMNENKNILSSDFDEKMAKVIRKLRYYYALNDCFEGYDEVVKEAKQMAEGIGDKNVREKTLSDILYYSTWYDSSEDLRKEARRRAEHANNANVVCDFLVNELFEIQDSLEYIKFIDEKAIPQMETMNSDTGKGILLFWRGRRYLELNNISQTYSDMKEAVKLIDRSDIYHACAVSAVKTIAFVQQYAENPNDGYAITSETLMKEKGELLFVSQPGFGSADSTLMNQMSRYNSHTYYLSRNSNMLFDISMKVGEKKITKDGVWEVISCSESVRVKAGFFENCMHIRLTYKEPYIGEYRADSYYAPNVGLIKMTFVGVVEEGYELCDYTIKGGSGYAPFCVGNRWEYDNPNLPDYVCRKYEKEIDWTDDELAHYSVVSITTLKKNYLTECTLDSDIYILEATKCCYNWKIEEAIENLKQVVRMNSTQEHVVTALGGIEYLKRLKEVNDKKYRICPSSYSTSYLIVGEKNNCCCYDESVYCFAPYKYGTRLEEHRIFGVKPFRYLQSRAGCVFDYERWIDGYTTQFKDSVDMDEIDNKLSVENVGAIQIKLGQFNNCLKVTINAELSCAEKRDYFNGYAYLGKKEFYFVKGIGLIKFDFTWGDVLQSSSELVAYELPAADEDSYFPVQIGNKWEYDEVNLTAENYRAKRIVKIACGVGNRYVLNDSQEFWYKGTEEAYEEMKANLNQ